MRHNQDRKPWIGSAGALVAAIAAVKLLLHLYAGRRDDPQFKSPPLARTIFYLR